MLTDTWLRKNLGRAQEKDFTKADSKGLEARVRATGTISFIYRGYLSDGTRLKMTLGKYPELGLKEARATAEQIRFQIEQGHDPRKKRKAEQLRNLKEPTISEVYDQWYEHYAVKNKKRHREHRRTYEIYIKPKFGDFLIKDMTRHIWVTYLIGLAAKVPEITSRIVGDLKQMYDYAIDIGIMDGPSVLAGVNRRTIGVSKKQRTRVLDDDDLRLFYRVLHDKNWNIKNRTIMELLIFYGCRAGEIRNTERSWLDFDKMTWTVPPEHHKTGAKTKRPLVRPILPEMVHLWEQAIEFSPSDRYVFTAMQSKTAKGDRLMSPGAIQDLPYKMINHARDNYVDEAGEPINWEKWTNHDLRRTARSRWSAWGDWATCEKMLGHKLPGEADVYDRHDYLAEMTPIYRKWWNKLKQLEQGDRKVVPLYRKQAG